jgi:hypothetical protein
MVSCFRWALVSNAFPFTIRHRRAGTAARCVSTQSVCRSLSHPWVEATQSAVVIELDLPPPLLTIQIVPPGYEATLAMHLHTTDLNSPDVVVWGTHHIRPNLWIEI